MSNQGAFGVSEIASVIDKVFSATYSRSALLMNRWVLGESDVRNRNITDQIRPIVPVKYSQFIKLKKIQNTE